MDQKTKNSRSEETLDRERRDAMLKLGKFAAYAVPFTLLASKATATQSGGGSGGRTQCSRPR